MTNIHPKYHPTPELLTDYASGSLRHSHALAVATHLEFCRSCRNTQKQLNLLGSAFFQTQGNTEQSRGSIDNLKDRLMKSLDDDTATHKAPDPEANIVDTNITDDCIEIENLSNTLKRFIASRQEHFRWSRPSLSMRILKLFKDRDGSVISLSKVRPGGKIASHTHTGDEITVVLKGSFSDESGVYCKGDFILRNSDNRHSPVVTRDAECICLVVLDSPIQFTGFLTKLLNPLLGPIRTV